MLKKMLPLIAFIAIFLVSCQKEVNDPLPEPPDTAGCKTDKIAYEVFTQEQGVITDIKDTFAFSYSGDKVARIETAHFGDFVFQYIGSNQVKITAYGDYTDPASEDQYLLLTYRAGEKIATTEWFGKEGSSYVPYNYFEHTYNGSDSTPSVGYVADYAYTPAPQRRWSDSFYYTFANGNLVSMFERNRDGMPELNTFTYNSNENRLLKGCPEMFWIFLIGGYDTWHDFLSVFVFSKNELTHLDNNLQNVDYQYTYDPRNGRLTNFKEEGEFDNQHYTGYFKYTVISKCE